MYKILMKVATPATIIEPNRCRGSAPLPGFAMRVLVFVAASLALVVCVEVSGSLSEGIIYCVCAWLVLLAID